MASIVVDVRHVKRCAFCKHWYDPANAAIAPKVPSIGLWEIRDINQKNMFCKKNVPMIANAFCSADYVKKL
jgi:hypothetical protein